MQSATYSHSRWRRVISLKIQQLYRVTHLTGVSVSPSGRCMQLLSGCQLRLFLCLTCILVTGMRALLSVFNY